ncbi:MAG TPA: CRTAC1 family protein, partial [Thermoanaerobaculia bacterium]|nr:CRTAC1 family protein [Thermoanaerobaculia bacterium]
RFRDVSREAGIAAVADAGLGVVAADFDDDGWIDVFVANDADPNHLWINQRDGTFAERAMVLGAAFNEYGVAEAGMGIAAGDVDSDGDLDLFVTHLIGETNTLYLNLGASGFADATAASGLGPPGAAYTGFGTAFFDLDNDGDLDTAVANGGVKRRPVIAEGAAPGFWQPYVEPNLAFGNRGDGKFTPLPAWSAIEVSRGLLPFDHDRDGDLDLLITTIDGPAHLYRNEGANQSSWIEIRAVDPSLHREALGAKVTAVAGDRRFVRHAISSGGYLTSGHGWIHLGLGSTRSVDRFEVRWPDGATETFAGAEAGRVVELRRGEGQRG